MDFLKELLGLVDNEIGDKERRYFKVWKLLIESFKIDMDVNQN
jgi:hypothetical protein